MPSTASPERIAKLLEDPAGAREVNIELAVGGRVPSAADLWPFPEVDAKAQIIVEAQAHGSGTEPKLLLPVVAALAPRCTATTLITADAGYHGEANLRALATQNRPALIADNGMRARDEHFAT